MSRSPKEFRAGSVELQVRERACALYHCYVIQTETRDNDTALPLVGVLVTWYGLIDYIINYIYKNKKLLNSINYMGKPKFFRLLWDIIVFRLLAYLLNFIWLIVRFLYKFYININFRMNLTQFYINLLRHERTLMGLLKCLGFSLYPFIFSLQSL